MRGEGRDSLARDQEGEVDRALWRAADVEVEGGATLGAARMLSLPEIQAALEQATAEGRAIVVLEVRRPGEGAVRARVPQMLWGALADALYAGTLDEEHAATQTDDA